MSTKILILYMMKGDTVASCRFQMTVFQLKTSMAVTKYLRVSYIEFNYDRGNVYLYTCNINIINSELKIY